MPKTGCITPSQFKKIMTGSTKKTEMFGKTALTYADEIILDIIGVERDEITAASLQHGIDNEPLAIDRYQEETFNTVIQPTQSIYHYEYDFICGRPDGLIGESGLIEIKSPWNPVNHLSNITAKQTEPLMKPDDSQISDYWWQIQGYLWITRREWLDFVSYDPRFPEPMQISIQRIHRNDDDIKNLETRCLMFWDIIQQKLKTLMD